MIYNKIDLADAKCTEAFKAVWRQAAPTAQEGTGSSRTSKDVQLSTSNLLIPPIYLSSSKTGATHFERAIKAKSYKKLMDSILSRYTQSPATCDPDFSIKIIVVGMPNVGKSTIINNMKAYGLQDPGKAIKVKTAVKVGAIPGITKAISGLIKLRESTPKIYVYDSPGIMLPNLSDVEGALKLALTGAISDRIAGEIHIADYLLFSLNKHQNFSYVKLYWSSIEQPVDHVYQLLDGIIKHCKMPPLHGNEPDHLRAAQHFITQYRSGKFGRLTFDDVQIQAAASPSMVDAP